MVQFGQKFELLHDVLHRRIRASLVVKFHLDSNIIPMISPDFWFQKPSKLVYQLWLDHVAKIIPPENGENDLRMESHGIPNSFVIN